MEFRVFFAYQLVFSIGILLTSTFKYLVNDIVSAIIVMRTMLIAEFFFLSAYYTLILKSRYTRPLFLIANFLFWICCYQVYKSLSNKEYSLLVIECLFFIVVIVYDFFEKMRYNVSEPIYHYSSFWVSVAFLIFFSGSVLIFIYSSALIDKNPNLVIYFNFIYGFFAILKNLLLSVAVLVHVYLERRPPKTIPVPVDLDLGFLKNQRTDSVLKQS